MKTVKVSMIVMALIMLVCSLFATQIQADPPEIHIYFNSELTQNSADCPAAPAGTVAIKIYVVAENFTEPISRIEYRLIYPSPLMWFGDVTVSGTTTGNTGTGIVHTWAMPQDASGKLVLAESSVLWMCDNCTGYSSSRFCVDSHSETGYLRAARASDSVWIYPLSLGAMICGCGSDEPISCTVTVPTEESSWGKIKAIYD